MTGHHDIHPDNLGFARKQTELIGSLPLTHWDLEFRFRQCHLCRGSIIRVILVPLQDTSYRSFSAKIMFRLLSYLCQPTSIKMNKAGLKARVTDFTLCSRTTSKWEQPCCCFAGWQFNQLSGGAGDTLVANINILVQADYANITRLGATDQRPGDAFFAYWIPVSRASTNTTNAIGFSLKTRSSFNYPFCRKALNGSFLYATSLTDTILS